MSLGCLIRSLWLMKVERRKVVKLSINDKYPEVGVVATSLVEIDGKDVEIGKLASGTHVRCWCPPIMGMRPLITETFMRHHYDYGYRIVFSNKDFGTSDLVVAKDQKLLVETDPDNKFFISAEDLYFDVSEGKRYYSTLGAEIISITEEESIECIWFDTLDHNAPVIGGIICGTCNNG